MPATRYHRLQSVRKFETLEDRYLLTRTLTIADPVTIFESSTGRRIVDHEFFDVDGDSIPELIVGQRTVSPSEGGILTLLVQDDSGRFHVAAEQAVEELQDLRLADFDGDDEMDVVLVRSGEVTSVSITGKAGVFDLHEEVHRFRSHVIEDPSQVVTLDLNGDAHHDVALSNPRGSSRRGTSVFLANPDGSHEPGVDYPTLQKLTDLNGDSFPDALTTGPEDATLTVWVNDQTGTFEEVAGTVSADTYIDEFQFGDMNGDDLTDIVLIDHLGLGIWTGKGDGTFEESPQTILAPTIGGYGDPGSLRDIRLSDVDGDGQLNIYIGAEWVPHGGTVPPRVLLRDGMAYEALTFPVSFPCHRRPIPMATVSPSSFPKRPSHWLSQGRFHHGPWSLNTLSAFRISFTSGPILTTTESQT